MILSALDLSPVTGDATQAQAVRETLEIAKAAVMRGSENVPFAGGVDLRLLGVEASDGSLVFGWLQSSDEAEGAKLRLARSVYNEIRSDAGGAWAELRAGIDAGYFVDLNRMLLDDT